MLTNEWLKKISEEFDWSTNYQILSLSFRSHKLFFLEIRNPGEMMECTFKNKPLLRQSI